MSGAETLTGRWPSRVMITTDCVGGVWSYTIQLARGLAGRGFEVFIAATGPAPDDIQRQEIRSIDGVDFDHIGYRLEWMERGCEDIDLCRKWLLDLEARFCPDVIHSNSYSLADAPFCAPVLVVAHSCIYSWWRAVHSVPPPEEWFAYRNAVIGGIRAAAAVVAPSRSMLHSLASSYDLHLSNSHVIYNGAPTAAVDFVPKQPVILGAGRVWDVSKNFSVLDEIAPHLEWPIRMAGAEESPGARRAFVPKNVKLLGALSRQALHESMRMAAVFAHPALYEPFGLAILEAAQCGCALVLSDIPSLRELWDNAALFCSPRDADAWTATLQKVLNSEDLRLDLACRARSRAARFTTERMVGEYQDLYGSLMTGYKPDARQERAS